MTITRTARRRTGITAALLLGTSPSFSSLSAQTGAPAAGGTTERIRIVNVAQPGAAPTGPAKVVIEHDQTLATHTIYRPADLGGAVFRSTQSNSSAC